MSTNRVAHWYAKNSTSSMYAMLLSLERNFILSKYMTRTMASKSIGKKLWAKQDINDLKESYYINKTIIFQ